MHPLILDVCWRPIVPGDCHVAAFGAAPRNDIRLFRRVIRTLNDNLPALRTPGLQTAARGAKPQK